jgi:hypothetical protein
VRGRGQVPIIPIWIARFCNFIIENLSFLHCMFLVSYKNQ